MRLKLQLDERNAKLALAFHSECSRGSIARSAVKGESGKLPAMWDENSFRCTVLYIGNLLLYLYISSGDISGKVKGEN